MPERRRRKSLSILKPHLTSLTPINEPGQSGSSSTPSLLKKRRPSILAKPSTHEHVPATSDGQSPVLSIPGQLRPKSSVDRLIQKTRPRSLQKVVRPSSIFGSFRGSPTVEDDENALQRTSSTPSSLHSQAELIAALASSEVLLHGNVQTSSGMFKKRTVFLVLTDGHLIKLRSQTRASEIFPGVPPSIGRASGARHSRLSSSGSMQDSGNVTEGLQAIPLNQIVACYRLDDGKPYFSIEIYHLDEENMQAMSMVLQLQDPRDHDLWLSSIRTAAMNARLKEPLPFSRQLVEYTARILEQDNDYDPNQLHIFRVVQRGGRASMGRSSSDDLTKLTSNVCILALGLFKAHVIPLPRSSKSLSSASLNELGGTSFGLANLSSFTVGDDDSFALRFRRSLSRPISIAMASSCVNDIALSTRRSADYLRPLWMEQPFTWNVPRSMDEDFLPMPAIDEEHAALDRTLAAYCSSYAFNASLIRYTVEDDGDGGLAFRLLSRADGQQYSILELLAIFRSLRYNESFTTMSFAGINLTELQKHRDPFGDEHVAWKTRSGEPLNHEDESKCTLLVQEVRALALNSVRLRRLDFSHCVSRMPRTENNLHPEAGCGICEAIFPLCAKQATNVDWIILNGIALSEVDIDYIFCAGIDRSSHLRAVQVGRCGLTDRGVLTILNALSYQSATLECLDIAGNMARLEPELLQDNFCSFEHIRKLDLSELSRTSGRVALLSFDCLARWRLEDLCLRGTPQNEQSIAALAKYLQHSQSKCLRCLDVERCQLDGRAAAILLEAMTCNDKETRHLRLILSGNKLESEHAAFIEALRDGKCPDQIIMQTIDYQDEANYRRLLDVLATNTQITYLDLSKALLPSDASQATCEALGRVFATNKTLAYLDLSGEHSHLVASSLGSGLNSALIGLKKNETLEVLRVENQQLGLQGASTLASVIEKNKSLREIHCEGNEINLQAFTVLVNSLEKNHTLLYLPEMAGDRASMQKKVDREMDILLESTNIATRSSAKATATVKRTWGRTISGQRPAAHTRSSSGSLPPGAIQAAMGSISEQWDKEVARLRIYLARNYRLSQGLPSEKTESAADEGSSTSVGPLPEVQRPTTSASLATAMQEFGLKSDKKGKGKEKEADSISHAERDGQLETVEGLKGATSPVNDEEEAVNREKDGQEEGEEGEDEEEAESPLEMRSQPTGD